MSWMNLDRMNHGMVVGGEIIYFMFYISMALMHGLSPMTTDIG